MIQNMTAEEIKAALAEVPEVTPEPDEIEAIGRSNKSITDHGAVPHDSINWD